MNLPIQLQYLETNYGHFLMNPIGDDLFIFSPEKMAKMNQAAFDLMVYGSSYMWLPKFKIKDIRFHSIT